ncbi:MAG: PilZ domain-containing protein [Nitrospirota bacterium]|nr:PilZ domain-containing protein [Nitrospirota bacterium]
MEHLLRDCTDSTPLSQIRQESSPITDRRRTPRHVRTSRLEYRATAGAGRGALLSLSVAGCTLDADMTFQEREPLTLLMYVGAHEPLVAIATVRWTCGGRCGVEFVCMNAGGQEQLRQMFNQTRHDSAT